MAPGPKSLPGVAKIEKRGEEKREMSMKEQLEELKRDLGQWQKAEKAGLSQTARVMEQTDNPLINTVMEIIQRDSHMHHRVQQMIRDTLDHQTVSLTPDELAKVWDGIETHIATEKKSIEYAESALKKLQQGQGRGYLVQQYLLSYLLEDEKKHDKLLEDLSLIKRNMYPYS
jgi:hypothetical protein